MWGNQRRDCTLASGEGHSSRGETFQPLYGACPVSSSAERRVQEKMKPAVIFRRRNTQYGKETLLHAGVCDWYSKFSEDRKEVSNLPHAHVLPAANAM
jgi:hypothetical protein